jgi:hypothetical protein
MGLPGLLELAKFVEAGGTLITDGSTTTIFPEYGITTGVTVEHPAPLFVRGSILRAKFADLKSPIAYGYDSTDLPVYFNQDPVLNAGSGGVPPEFAAFFGGGAANAGLGQNITPNAVPVHVSPYEALGTPAPAEKPQADAAAEFRRFARAFGVNFEQARPRVVLQFASNPTDLLLSGTLANGQFLANRAAALDVSLGKGHVVMFALRPFWRWQTQGTYTLGFNAIMNWNHLDAGRSAPARTASPQ